MPFYKATHSNGKVVLRDSTSKVYSHAVVFASGNASFAGRIDLARKHLSSCYDQAQAEVVPAVEITRAEHATILKASKQHFTFIVEGKKVARTRPVGTSPIAALLVEVYEARETGPHYLSDSATQDAVERSLRNGAQRDAKGAIFWMNQFPATVAIHEAYEKSGWNKLADYQARVDGTYQPRDHETCHQVGEGGLVKRYLAFPV